MSLQLDHFFVLTEQGAPEADSLIAMGFDEGSPNSHPGQGTANRRFFFANTAIELLYVRDENEEMAGQAARFQFSARVRNKTASPFGFVFRSTSENDANTLGPSWKYEPEYLPPGAHMIVANSSGTLVEPTIVIMPAIMHAGGERIKGNPQSLSRLHLTVPAGSSSPAVDRIASLSQFDVRRGSEHLLDIVFDDGVADRYRDLRPRLPITVRC